MTEQELKKEVEKVLEQQPDSKVEIQKSSLSEVQEALQKLKDANDGYEKEMLRQQELRAKVSLGGKSLAGQVAKEKTTEELAKEEAENLYKRFRTV